MLPKAMDIEFDTTRSLIALDPDAWDPDLLDEDALQIMQRVAHKPVRKLNPAELHALVKRNLALRHSIPLALAKLEDDPMLQAERHPGDLLTALLETDTRYWLDEYDRWLEVIGLLSEVLDRVKGRMEQEEREDYMPWHVGDDFMAALLHFRGIHQAADIPPQTETP